jgi:hypothetical protein
MDKLKSVFKHGGKQEDDVKHSSGTSSTTTEPPAKLTTDPGVKDNGIARQILCVHDQHHGAA